MKKEYINLGRTEREKIAIQKRVQIEDVEEEIDKIRLSLLRLKERVKALRSG